MADDDGKYDAEDVTGEKMIVATSMLKAPKAVTSMKFIPRTIEWERIIVIGIFALVTWGIYAAIFPVALNVSIYVLALGGALGYVIPYLSPLEGESLLTWFGLQGREATAKRVNVNGRRVKMYVGTYPLKRVAAGKMRLYGSGVHIQASHYDERGYPQLETKNAGNTELEQQRKMRALTQKKGKRLKASTTLTSHASARADQQQRAQPRLPKAGEKKNVPSLTKPTRRKKRKQLRARPPRT